MVPTVRSGPTAPLITSIGWSYPSVPSPEAPPPEEKGKPKARAIARAAAPSVGWEELNREATAPPLTAAVGASVHLIPPLPEEKEPGEPDPAEPLRSFTIRAGRDGSRPAAAARSGQASGRGAVTVPPAVKAGV